MTAERKRQLALFLATIAILGLLGYASFQIAAWRSAGGSIGGGLAVKQISLRDAPEEIQAAAAHLAPSRVGYAISTKGATYLVISTGSSGELVSLAGAERIQGVPTRVQVNLRASPGGHKLIIARIHGLGFTPAQVGFAIDGREGAIPALVNHDGLPVVTLPNSEHLAVLAPEINARVVGGSIEVQGYARLHSGRLSVQVFSAGKGRVLGESVTTTAADYPDWGSFRTRVQVEVDPSHREGVLLIYDPDSGAKAVIPIRFADK